MKLLGCKVCGRIAHGHAGLKVCCSNDDCPLSRVLMLPDQWNQRCKGEVEAREKLEVVRTVWSRAHGLEDNDWIEQMDAALDTAP